jgi:hypothetical protein
VECAAPCGDRTDLSSIQGQVLSSLDYVNSLSEMQLSVSSFDLRLIDHRRFRSVTTRYLSLHFVAIVLYPARSVKASGLDFVMQSGSDKKLYLKSDQMGWSAM